MALTDIVSPSTLGSTYVSEETVTYGVTGTERRIYPTADTVETDAMQVEIDRKNLRTRPFDLLNPVLGYKDGTVKFSHYLQPAPTVLVQAAVVDTDALAPLAVPLRVVFGGQSVFAGTVVAAGTGGVSGFDAAAGEGALTLAGQIILVTDPDAAIGLIPARVLTRIVDAITFYPNASGALADASPVINTWTFYPSRLNGKSLSFAACAAQDAAYQWRYNGCVGSVELKFDRGALAIAAFDFKAATWTGPSALALAITDATDPMAPPLACRNAVLYLQSQATTTRVNYAVDSFVAKLSFGNRIIETLTGGTEGKRAAFRADALTDTFAEITVTFAWDSAWEAAWAARTELTAMLSVQIDSGADRRMVIVDVPRAIIVGKPKHAKGADGLVKTTLTLRARLDDSTTQGLAGVAGELAEAPFRLALA